MLGHLKTDCHTFSAGNDRRIAHQRAGASDWLLQTREVDRPYANVAVVLPSGLVRDIYPQFELKSYHKEKLALRGLLILGLL